MRHLRQALEQSRRAQQGFTLVELMIALSILATLLVMSTVLLVNLGHLYTKGVNEAATQNTARNIVNDVSSQLQLSGSTVIVPPFVPNGTNVVCLGSQRYTYTLNHKLVNPPASGNNVIHALWRDTMNSGASCTALDLSAATPKDSATVRDSGSELLPVNTRITDFKINDNGNNTYSILVTVAYGDDDLVNYDATNDTTGCSGDVGTEYCAVSSLNVTVLRRTAQ